jgi:hypothetical protein
VKIFGERNTGTNALSRIIEANSEARCLPATSGDLNPLLGRIGNTEWLPGKRIRERLLDSIFEGQSPLCAWKHCATNFPDAAPFDGVFVLFTIRHPGSWLVSLFKRPYQRLERRPATLAEFLNSEWETAGRELLGRARFRPLELLQAKLGSYLGFADKLTECGIAHRFLRFEDIVLNQAGLYSTIAPELENARSDFHELESSTKERSKTLDDYRDYYGRERWREALIGLEASIDAQIDWSKFTRFGYQPLSARINATPGHREDQQGQVT